ncbi:Fc.00g077690.m01.CDS01 [Cosmosporella sp. VM-42]
MVRDLPRDSLPRFFQHPQERYGEDGIDDGRFMEPPDTYRRQPPMEIDEALRRHCGINGKRFFVAAIQDDGRLQTFSAPGTNQLGIDVVKQFFDEEKYRRVISRLEAGVSPVVDDGFGLHGIGGIHGAMGFPRNRTLDRRRMSNFEDWDNIARQNRKRPRARHPINDDDDVPMTVSTTRKGIKIGNSDEVWNFYEQRFKNCQQTACKLIAKAWVKAVEPKKQSTHPYTGSDEKAPDWWPKPWGPTKEDKVRHKEPDHLYKRERVHLLNHILRMIVEPNKTQHPDIQKLNLNVKKLEELTTEALSAFFTDKENPANAKKRPYLNEIFKVAKQEERFKNGEIDGTTEIYVMAEDKMPETYSENDDGSMTRDEDEQDTSPAKPSVTHGLMQASTTDHSSTATLHSSSFLGDLPVRGSQYPPPMMQEMAPEQHSFVEGSGLPVNGQAQVHANGGNLGLDMGVPSPHDNSRRPSLFSAAQADYSNQGANSMYTQQWQPGSTAPNTSSMYTFTQQQTNQPQGSFGNPTVPMNQSQAYLGSSFDGLTRTNYDPNQSSLFRSTGVPQQPVHPSQTYNYMSHDVRVPGVKVDPSARPPMH